MISIITIANKQDVYEGFLRSLDSQTGVDYELITIPNYHSEEHSARQAYNKAARDANGEYLVFVHPDIRFLSATALQDMMAVVEQIPEFGVIGVAGADAPVRGHMSTIYTNILQGKDKRPLGRSVSEAREVQTVDECLFIVEREWFLQHPFSSRDGWHLYAVEFCLECLMQGRRNYVIPSDVWHLSDGRSLDPAYVAQIREMIARYKDRYDWIYTTVKAWKTQGIRAHIYVAYYYCKQRLKKLLK